MEETTKSLKEHLFTFIGWLEKLAIVTIVIGAFLRYQNIPTGDDLLLVSLAILAISLFVTAYKPKEIFSSQEEADSFGEFKFSDMLGLIIIPKILWLASGVTAFGLFAYVADFGNDGFIRILGIGCTTIAIGLLILLGTMAIGTKKMNTVRPVLGRAIPLIIAGLYILFG